MRLLRSCVVHLNGILVRRGRIADVGEFRTDLLTSEDYEYTLRLARGVPVAICPAPTFVFRQHAGMRGPSGNRYSAADRLRKFARGDAEIGRSLRSSHHLAEFLGYSADHALSAADLCNALLARLEVMAGKGLVAELAEDAVALAHALDTSGRRIDQETAAILKLAMQQHYLMLHLAESTRNALAALAPLSLSTSGREMLYLIARAVAGAASWQPLHGRERVRLVILSARLFAYAFRSASVAAADESSQLKA